MIDVNPENGQMLLDIYEFSPLELAVFVNKQGVIDYYFYVNMGFDPRCVNLAK